MSYLSMTRIGKAYGLTPNQMKMILVEEGLLASNGPTQKCLDEDIARLKPLNPEAAYSRKLKSPAAPDSTRFCQR